MLSGNFKSRKFGTGVFGGQCLVQEFLWVLFGTPGIFLGFGFRPFHFKSGSTPGRSSRNYYQRLSLLTHWIIMTFLIALMHVYVTWEHFTTLPRFEILKLQSFAQINFDWSGVEKNTHAHLLTMRRILLRNEAWWWNLFVWRNQP